MKSLFLSFSPQSCLGHMPQSFEPMNAHSFQARSPWKALKMQGRLKQLNEIMLMILDGKLSSWHVTIEILILSV